MNQPTTFCSVIIPTVGRSTLARAVESVLNQGSASDRCEVVVVNDSGAPLPPESWQSSSRVRVINTQRRRQLNARNAGAATAVGRYLLFLDDDDWLLPCALDYYWDLAQQYPDAGCLFGSFELVDDQANVIARYRLPGHGNVSVQLVSWCWMQIAAVLMRSDVYFAAGGFSPHFPISEETDLFGRIAIREDFAGTDTVVAQIDRGRNWQTSLDYSVAVELNRWARDRALSMPGAFDRLRRSAGASSYWYGRFVRLYAVSILWNVRRKRRFCVGASRGVDTLRSLLSARSHLFAREFWRGIRDTLPKA